MAYVRIERIVSAVAALSLVALIPSTSSAQARPPLEVIQLRDNFYAIVGAGATVAVQAGPDGVILVDTGSGERSADVVAEIRKITSRPIRYIINTSAHRDHVGGNDDLSKAGQSVIPTGGLNEIGAAGGRAPILAEEHVQAAMTAPHGEQAPFPIGAWPTVTYSSDLMETQKDLYFNGEAIVTTYQPSAYSDGDSVVFFRRSDVVVAGEVYDPTRFPRIDLEKGGSIQGVIDALNRIIGITVPPIPLIWQDGGTVVIGARGRWRPVATAARIATALCPGGRRGRGRRRCRRGAAALRSQAGKGQRGDGGDGASLEGSTKGPHYLPPRLL